MGILVVAKTPESTTMIEADGISIHLDSKVVYAGGKQVKLTDFEYKVLELLFLRKGTLVTKAMFFNHLYGEENEPGERIVDVFICKLRKKLNRATGNGGMIETLWGRGYMLRPHQVAPRAPNTRWTSGRKAQVLKSIRDTGTSHPFFEDEISEMIEAYDQEGVRGLTVSKRTTRRKK